MKKNIALAIWFLGMVIVALLLFGCASNKQEEYYDLLHREGMKNMAYKSITIKDYKPDEFN
jgi:uncharacterized lipoprotein YmbA